MHGRWMKHGRWLGRGDFRFLVLKTLKERPMHGYEVAKEIGARFDGFYAPSAGVVYPTLQWLEDEGHVGAIAENGKRIYKITKSGINFLKEKKETVDRISKESRGFMSDEKVEVFRAGRKLQQTIALLSTDLSKEKAAKATKILEDARKKMTGLLVE